MASPLMNQAEYDETKLPPIVARLERGEQPPICVIVVGMAGSGKTTLLAQLQQSLDSDTVMKDESSENDSKPAAKETPSAEPSTTEQSDPTEEKATQDESQREEESFRSYCINLDPATVHVPYDVSIDIRDTVDYHQVMRQHRLGPNGAILTSLNLFVTKFHQVLQLLERRAYGEAGSSAVQPTAGSKPDTTTPHKPAMDYILVDTPGQIEAFTWSASGSIISDSLASAFPTVLVFVVDTARCASSPNTFMSNMLYACSMLYRTRLPLVVCFNKTDVVSHEFCLEWMRDFEAFQAALDECGETAGFYGSLTRSLSLVLDEFYSSFVHAVGVSAVTGQGMDEFWKAVDKAGREDFVSDYIDDLKHRVEEQAARRQAVARHAARRLQRDVAESG